MSTGATDGNLQRLAAAAGIEVTWTDAYGQPQTATTDALRAILEALALPCGSASQTADSLAHVQRRLTLADMPPLITAVVDCAVRLPPIDALYGKAVRVQLETGATRDTRISADRAQAPMLAAIDQPGYHRLFIAELEFTVAVAPARCFTIAEALAQQHGADDPATVRGWGLALQLYALRSAGDGGIGDFGGLAQLAGAAGHAGAAALTISPVHAMYAADAHRFSPYSPSSRLYLNAMHIDPAAVLGPQALAQVLDENDAAVRAVQQQLQQAPLIDWPQAGRHKMAVLRRLHALVRSDPAQAAQLAAFCQQGGAALAHHALFEAYSCHLAQTTPEVATDWRRWPAGSTDPQAPLLQAFAREHQTEIEFHLFLQWQAARGLQAAQQAARDAGMAIGLVSDLAVGADLGGSQCWSQQPDMLNGLSVGAPPDLLNVHGQHWGVGVFSPVAMRRHGYRAYLAMLRACLSGTGGVRIDHILGLTRLWLAPDSAGAGSGAYLRYPQQDLLRLIALESWRHRAIIIGEDLGTVPPGFENTLRDAGVAGMRVLWFQRDGKKFLAPQHWSPHAVAMTSTHDLPTVAGWWRGDDIDTRAQLGLLPDEVTPDELQVARVQERTALWQAMQTARAVNGDTPTPQQEQLAVSGALAFLGHSAAPLVLLPLEDVLGLRAQANVPGTVDTHPNWRQRLPGDAAGLLSAPVVRTRLEMIRTVRTLRNNRRRSAAE